MQLLQQSVYSGIKQNDSDYSKKIAIQRVMCGTTSDKNKISQIEQIINGFVINDSVTNGQRHQLKIHSIKLYIIGGLESVVEVDVKVKSEIQLTFGYLFYLYVMVHQIVIKSQKLSFDEILYNGINKLFFENGVLSFHMDDGF